MKELIGTAILIVGLCAGTPAMRPVYEMIRKSALQKVGAGLTPLPRFNRKQ